MDSKVLKVTKRTVVGFFTIIFILGFFSKSTIALFLPKVHVAPAMKNSFSRTLDVEGTIVPKATAKIRLGGNVIIEEFYVKSGREIKKGQPIFRINNKLGIKASGESIKDLMIMLDKQRLEHEILSASSYEVDQKNIQLLEEKLNAQKQKVEKLQKLYDSGAIASSELEQSKMELKADELNLEIKKLQMKTKESEDAISIKELQKNIQEVQDKITELGKQQEFYSNVADDGVYYSEFDGIILNTNKTDQILNQDTTIVEIALVDGFDTVMFNASIPEKHYDFVNSTMLIELTFDDRYMPDEVRITNISKLADDSMIEIEGEFSESTKKPIVGQQIRGRIVKNFKQEGTIPKDAVIPNDDFEIGKSGRVYVIEEKKGILGTEYFAKEVSVTLTGVGDNRVSVTGIESFDKRRVITNLSYKIKDGAKVFLWE